MAGLSDRSRRPHYSPNALEDRIRRQIIRLRKKMPHCVANYLHREFGVKASSKTIQKVFRQEGLNRSRKSKRSKQRDLRPWKEANFEPLRYFQVDTKDCQDVPYYVECTWKAHFPRYLYQAKEFRTGVLYYAFAYERTTCPGLPVGPASLWPERPGSRARVTILDDPKCKNLNFILRQSVNHVCKLDKTSAKAKLIWP